MTDTAIGQARFDFGRVVSQTFALIGRNFFAFALLALVLVGAPPSCTRNLFCWPSGRTGR
jgi:hypothetical protein